MRRPPAYHGTRQGRACCVGAGLTGMLHFSGRPKGIRVSVHEGPGRQAAFHRRPRRPVPLRQRYQNGQFARLAHCRCARCEDKIIPQPSKHRPAQSASRLHPRSGWCKLAATTANGSPGSSVRNWP